MKARWPVAGAAAAAVAWYASDSLRHRREGGHGYELCGESDPSDPSFMRACEALTGAPLTRGNDVELLINGEAIFPVFLGTIRAAKRTVNLLTYVYWQGDIADEVAQAISDRARAGVECRVLVDAIGAAKMSRGLIESMEDAGVTFARFRPVKPYALSRINNRTHRKVLVADGEVGMIGGVGIADEWTGDGGDPEHWRDTHVRVRGPVVSGLQGAFAENWLEATGQVLAGPEHLPELAPRRTDGPLMQVVRSTAGVGDTDAEALYFLAVASAKESIELTAAYFAPRPAFVKALGESARRGVAVQILVPGSHIDKSIVRTAGRRVYDELLDCGVRIYEYSPTMLHAKTMVVDGAWSAVGSVNFDNRSFQLNDEATLCVQDRGFADELHRQFEIDLEASEAIEPGAWRDRPLRQRASERATQLARREL